MCNRRTDVFVIGGGPAGLAAAIASRRQGFRVMLADGAAPPVDKACGEGLLPDTLRALVDLGVTVPQGVGHALRGIRFVNEKVEASAEFPEGRGVGLRRTELHDILLAEAERYGVEMLWRTPVIGIEKDGVCLNTGMVKAQWIVGADGGHSRVRRWSDLEPAITNSRRLANRQHYRIRPWTEYTEAYWGPRLQTYVTPIGVEEVCVVVMGETAKEIDFAYALGVLPQLKEKLAGAESSGRERGATTAMQVLHRVWRGNVALVGDASGGVDAITGEGLRLTFRQAQALAKAMWAGDLAEYGREHRQLLRRPLWMARLLRLLGDSSRLRSKAFEMLNRNPALFARLLAIHLGEAKARDVVSTSVQLGWQFLAS